MVDPYPEVLNNYRKMASGGNSLGSLAAASNPGGTAMQTLHPCRGGTAAAEKNCCNQRFHERGI